MKISLFISLLTLSVSLRAQTLSAEEKTLLRNLKCSESVAEEIKSLTLTDIWQLPAIDSQTGQLDTRQYYPGLYSEVREEDAGNTVLQLKAKLKDDNYLVFFTEAEDDKKFIAAIKGSDEMAIIRYRQTDGPGFELKTEDIIKHLETWQSEYGLIILGCGKHWIWVRLEQVPEDMGSFLPQVVAFCPGAIDEAGGTRENLLEFIRTTNTIMLSWE